MKRKHVKNFSDFVNEQGVELGTEGPVETGGEDAPATDAPAEGGQGDPQEDDDSPVETQAAKQRLKIAFVPMDKNGNAKYRRVKKELNVYTVFYEKVKEWADKYLPKNKVEDFINILKLKHDMDTMPEKGWVNQFKKDVLEKRLGDKSGTVSVEFDEKAEPYTDQLNVTLLYYDPTRAK